MEHIIWNNGAGLQTYDITSVTASTCYKIGEPTGLYNALIIDCNTPIGEGLENLQGDDVQCTKVLIDNIIYILRGDKIYTITGQEVN